MKTTILIVDDIHEIMLEKFEEAGIAFHYQPGYQSEAAEKLSPITPVWLSVPNFR
jgi:D-3-phosphoglycerate dehydrogenase